MKPGQVVLVKFPFSDLQTTKQRPALVISISEVTQRVRVATIAMITSQIDGLKFSGDYLLKNWKGAGLLHPSVVRLAKLTTIEFDLVAKQLGTLENIDLTGVKNNFRKQFKSWL